MAQRTLETGVRLQVKGEKLMKKKALVALLVVMLALGGGVLLSACADEDEAPGRARNGFKFDAQTGRLLLQAGGVTQVTYPVYETHAASDTLTRKEVGSIHTASANVTLTLPTSSVAGDGFTFVIKAAAGIVAVRAPSAGAIYLDGTKGSDNYIIFADDEGESINLIAIGSNDWVAWGAEDVANWTARVAW